MDWVCLSFAGRFEHRCGAIQGNRWAFRTLAIVAAGRTVSSLLLGNAVLFAPSQTKVRHTSQRRSWRGPAWRSAPRSTFGKRTSSWWTATCKAVGSVLYTFR